MYSKANPFPRRSTLADLWELAAWRALIAAMLESLAAR
jgi:hypothetical protein